MESAARWLREHQAHLKYMMDNYTYDAADVQLTPKQLAKEEKWAKEHGLVPSKGKTKPLPPKEKKIADHVQYIEEQLAEHVGAALKPVSQQDFNNFIDRMKPLEKRAIIPVLKQLGMTTKLENYIKSKGYPTLSELCGEKPLEIKGKAIGMHDAPEIKEAEFQATRARLEKQRKEFLKELKDAPKEGIEKYKEWRKEEKKRLKEKHKAEKEVFDWIVPDEEVLEVQKPSGFFVDTRKRGMKLEGHAQTKLGIKCTLLQFPGIMKKEGLSEGKIDKMTLPQLRGVLDRHPRLKGFMLPRRDK